MRYLPFILFVYLLSAIVYAGPGDKWTYVGYVQPSFDGIALLLAVGAFAWVYVIYRDAKRK